MDEMTDSDDNIEIIGGDDPRLAAAQADGDDRSVTDLIEQPAKVMRIGTMIKQLLEEVRAAPLDDASRARLRAIHATSIRELEDGLAPELREELERLALPFTEDTVPSDAELRIAQAALFMDEHGLGERVTRLALVEPGLTLLAERPGFQPVERE